MKLDWKARLTNKAFWLALAAAVILLTQQLGFEIFPDNAMDVVNTILLIATILGIIVDPTTPGIGDNTNIDNPKLEEVK